MIILSSRKLVPEIYVRFPDTWSLIKAIGYKDSQNWNHLGFCYKIDSIRQNPEVCLTEAFRFPNAATICAGILQWHVVYADEE